MIFKKTGFLLLILLTALMGCSSGGDDPPTTPTVPDTALEFITRGWNYFESQHYDEALADFDSALGIQPNHGEALAGKAWSTLKLSTAEADLTAAADGFETALGSAENESYVLAGLAAARLAQGAAHLAEAISNAATVLATDPTFTFEHQLSFNASDMHLISAFAEAAAGDFVQALSHADLVVDSGIELNHMATWVVAGVTHSNFNAAVLARLHELSEQYAG